MRGRLLNIVSLKVHSALKLLLRALTLCSKSTLQFSAVLSMPSLACFRYTEASRTILEVPLVDIGGGLSNIVPLKVHSVDYNIIIGWYDNDPEMRNMKFVDGVDLTKKSFCDANNKTREERYYKMAQENLKFVTIGCETRLPEDTCKRFQEVTKCAGILYQEMELNGKCGIDVL
ncbi:hypothetical protein CDAR_443841 [Caerostris darwini]|uniref:Uncharacterized protein n=1 Tax=Caerostris darwini TaxID=1538125 RepID=A0AAV4XAV5_9ARAC|nr:hypothetical protein CDAR_443841 [Caerostris darwini]